MPPTTSWCPVRPFRHAAITARLTPCTPSPPPAIFSHLAEFTSLKALNLRKNFLTGPLPDSLGDCAGLLELELDGA